MEERKGKIARPRFVKAALAWGAALAVVLAAETATAQTELTDSHVTVSGTGLIVDGDEDQFSQRHGVPTPFVGGIEDLHMGWKWGEGGSVELDGRGVFPNHDYLARIRAEQPDKGYVAAGYREFRTWYDGTGGFFPQNGLLISYFDEELTLDRGEAWLEAGLRLPNVPRLTARYAHLFRDGQKGSTTWGDTQLTGGFGTRNIVPAFWDIDERRDIFDFDVEHRIRTTDVGAGVTYESSEIDNGRNVRRRPNEAPDRVFTQEDEVSSDVWDAHAFTSTPFLDDRVILATSYAFGDVHNDLGGSRIYGAEFNPAFDPTFANRQPFDEGFLDLEGGSQLHQHVGTITAQARASEHLHVTGGLRAKREDFKGDSNFVETTVGVPPALATTLENLSAFSETNYTSLAESAEVRYTGIENWVLWLDGEWEQEDGDLFEIESDADTGAVALERDTEMDISRQKYGTGATWYPAKQVNVAGRYTYKFHKIDFDHDVDSTPNNAGTDRFPAFIIAQNIYTHAADVRLTWRLLSNLRATTRYDIAFSEFEQESDFLAEVKSAKIHTHRIGGNVNWNPSPASYVQGDVNYVISETDMPADELSGAADGLIVDFDNDYWTASLVSGVALGERTDLRAQYFYFRADNYDDNSAVGQPFGLDAEEHGLSLALSRRLTDSVSGRVAYGFFTNDEKLAGGANDYDASAITGTLEVKF